MAVRTLPYADSLDRHWEELIYTEARLLSDARAADLAPPIALLITRVESTRQEQRTTWRDEVRAQAAVDAADDALDEDVAAVAKALLDQTRGDRKDPRYRRYFPKAPSDTIALGLQSELGRVESWPASLQGDPDPALQALGEKLQTSVEQGKAALGERTRAAMARADYRVRSIVRLIDDINAARLSLFGTLAQRAATTPQLDRAWPDRFFRHVTRKPKAAKPSAPPAPSGGEPEEP